MNPSDREDMPCPNHNRFEYVPIKWRDVILYVKTCVCNNDACVDGMIPYDKLDAQEQREQ